MSESKSTEKNQVSAPWKKPVLCLLAIVVILIMLRLGVWQLDRADVKRDIASQLYSRTERAPEPFLALQRGLSEAELRFRNVILDGQFISDKTIFVDNQVVNGSVGYQVYTPFHLASVKQTVLVARGWVAVGDSRDVLPKITTDPTPLTLKGRFNLPPAQPPLWDDKYAAFDGQRWQYLPMLEVSQQLGLALFPLVVELAPDEVDAAELVRKWPAIDDQWVAKHQGYAFQWFAMAGAFFIACLVLLFRRSTRNES